VVEVVSPPPPPVPDDDPALQAVEPASTKLTTASRRARDQFLRRGMKNTTLSTSAPPPKPRNRSPPLPFAEAEAEEMVAVVFADPEPVIVTVAGIEQDGAFEPPLPVQVRLTVPVSPPAGETVIVSVPEVAAAIVRGPLVETDSPAPAPDPETEIEVVSAPVAA
jgi:hypothetical protein